MRFSVDIKFSRLVHDHVPEQNSTAPLRDIAWKVTPAYPIGLPFAFKAWFVEISLAILGLIRRLGFGMGFFRDPESRSREFGIGIFYFGLDRKIPKIPKSQI